MYSKNKHMEYRIDNLLDETRSYEHLMSYIHADGLHCPGCGTSDYRVHSRSRAPILQYKCRRCSRYFNLFTGTSFEATRWPCSKIVMVLRGFLQGQSTLHMSKEMGLGYRNLLYLRHELMGNAYDQRTDELLPDLATESDEMYQNAGEKGILHPDPLDPPRRRANKKKALGHGKTTAPRFLAP